MGGAVDGVVGVHVACGALPLVGDGEGDGVVGNEEVADVRYFCIFAVQNF